jgi:hypothetical protein
MMSASLIPVLGVYDTLVNQVIRLAFFAFHSDSRQMSAALGQQQMTSNIYRSLKTE